MQTFTFLENLLNKYIKILKDSKLDFMIKYLLRQLLRLYIELFEALEHYMQFAIYGTVIVTMLFW